MDSRRTDSQLRSFSSPNALVSSCILGPVETPAHVSVFERDDSGDSDDGDRLDDDDLLLEF